MRLQRNSCYSLCQIHKKLDLSQSSLASSIDNLPDQLNFTGIVTQYEELQFVGWQKEVILTLSEGCIETLRVTMWLNHQNPVGLTVNSQTDIVGKLVHLKHVRVTGFDFSDQKELQFYGRILPCTFSRSIILVLVASGGSAARFFHRQTPIAVNGFISSVPKALQFKNSTSYYPLLPDDQLTLSKPLSSLKTFHYCVSNEITFAEPRNPFQVFINMSQMQDLPHFARKRHYSQRWVRSYEQQSEWEMKAAKRNHKKFCEKPYINTSTVLA